MSRELQTLHNVAYFVGALAHGAEQNLGRGSLSICSMAGKKFGQEAVEGGRQTDDPEEAVAILQEALKKQGIVWDFAESVSPLFFRFVTKSVTSLIGFSFSADVFMLQ